MTKEEIKIEATKIAMKESCHRCDKVLCDSPSEYCKWFNGCYKLAKENAELKKQNESLKDTLQAIATDTNEHITHNVAQNELDKWELAE